MKLISVGRFSVKLILNILFLFATFAVFGSPADVDTGFYPKLTKDITSNLSGKVALQPDGKLIVFGTYTDSATSTPTKGFIQRLNVDGTTDTTFNCSACYSFLPGAVVVQPDGKILVGGFNVGLISSISTIIRLNSDGSLDSTFSAPSFQGSPERFVLQADGKVLIDVFTSVQGFGQHTIRRLNTDGSVDSTFTTITLAGGRSSFQYASEIVPLPDGKILLGGGFSGIGSSGFLLRYNANGTADSTFEAPTFADARDNRSYVSAIEFQSDGKYLVAGDFTSVNGISRLNVVRFLPAGNVDQSFSLTFDQLEVGGELKLLSNGQFVLTVTNVMFQNSRLVRYNSDGTVDNSFGPPTDLPIIANNWTVDNLNRIVLFTAYPVGVYRFARLNTNGSLDTTFNPVITVNGIVTTLTVQPDGKVLVSGDFQKANTSDKVRLTRLNADGTTDTSFDTGSGFNTPPNIMTVQTDGKILVGGDFSSFNGNTRSNIVRLNSDGSLDSAFNPNVNGSILAIETLSNGKILIGGAFTTVNGTTQAGIARLNADGTLDTSFNPIFGTPTIRAIFIQSDGKIMVGGGFSGVNGFNRSSLVRLNADGSLDTSFNVGSISAVYQIILQSDGKYLLSQNITLLRRNNDGTADSSFVSPTVGGTINTIIQKTGGEILIGGSFVGVNNATRNNLARLKPNGELDLLFPTYGTNSQINKFAAQADGKIIVGGFYSLIEGVPRSGLARLTLPPLRGRTIFDYDGDGKADISVFRPSENKWFILGSSNLQPIQTVFALAGDIPTPGDYDGDGKTDLSIFRPSTGDWWYLSSVTNGQVRIHWGQAGDIPRPSDYDGDGKTDFIVFRPSDSVWYRLGTSAPISIGVFGSPGDQPLVGDFDGDGKSDPSVFRPSSGDWWFSSSVTGQYTSVHWGAPGDIPAPADYDGDGKTDFAVYRPSNGGWYILNSSNLSFTIQAFGLAGDKPIPADYDGDGKADIAVFRPSTGIWYLLQSTSGFGALQWGVSTDIPTENAFLPQ